MCGSSVTTASTMEPDVIRVPNSVSFSEFETPGTFDQAPALTATSPPELNSGGVVGFSDSAPMIVSAKPNGIIPSRSDSPSGRTLSTEELKRLSERHMGSFLKDSDRTEFETPDCNGGVDSSGGLTNGFSAFGAPKTHVSHVSLDNTATNFSSTQSAEDDHKDDFADFSAFSNTNQCTNESPNWEKPFAEEWQTDEGCSQLGYPEERAGSSEEDGYVRNGIVSEEEQTESISNGERGFDTTKGQRDPETDSSCCNTKVAVTHIAQDTGAQNGRTQGPSDEEEEEDIVLRNKELDMSRPGEHVDEKRESSENETETETETSFGRPLSTDALEEFGDFSTTGSVPSPPLQEEMATPAEHSQLADDDEDFGDFGDFGEVTSFGGGQGFADFDQPLALPDQGNSATDTSASVLRESALSEQEELCNVDDSGEVQNAGVTEGSEGDQLGDFPASDSFADFSSAPLSRDMAVEEGGWTAFDKQEEDTGAETWANFGEEQSTELSEKGQEEWQVPVTDGSRRDSSAVSLLCQLERLFQVCFHETTVVEVVEDMLPLKSFLEPTDESQPQKGEGAVVNGGLWTVWHQLQDIHNAFGLRYQWGGSHSNKTLLCSLGIDTRNILFTGQKKQPVIVPMYAASLGMLEPTKEPMKPVSAAEMIASIAQTPAAASEMGSCPSYTAQEALPPVQFDWSSSGLTNPLDASGGSALLNLDFFGPVEESASSSATSIPGVDPELYELTTAKLDQNSTGSRVADAFARLMSTVEKNSTSTRKPRKEENLSEEALKVICSLPDLSFMQAKVLMFPTTLTPLASSEPMPD
ncbi:aftiphilin a isoform X2 [Denticeps clupeoides]|uniref:aftiphilin a isoform X2 n=1 Tax=Denticeps clupeoides TaxID=299321 RepID=UPI0010A55D88|nr:aftiphilin-like isoform X2 [Denticeps clupeoides]